MGTITVGVDDEIEEHFRLTVKRTVGAGKGTLGKAVAEAMEKWAKEKDEKEMRKRALERLERGYSMGKILYKNREELHER